MSMRATFTTNFIYDGSDAFLYRKEKMCEILNIKMDLKGSSMIGQLSGILSGSDLGETDIRRWIEEQCYELHKITKVPFKIVYLLEGGDIVIKEINPWYADSNL